jgi:hypothetical protein
MESVMPLSTFFAAAEAGRRKPQPSHLWTQYFLHNRDHLHCIPWELGGSAPREAIDAIASSIRQFQLGESSEGLHFIRAARHYGRQSGDLGYVRALKLFIAEEQRHGADLGRALDLYGIPRLRASWSDTIFRWLRRRAGLELSIAVLVTAEIIAKIYYQALRDATTCPALRTLCAQILHDEIEHVRFQAERLAILRRRRPGAMISLGQFAHRVFFAGTCVVVWLQHGRALRRGGFGLARFWREALGELRDALWMTDPRTYAFGDAPDGAADITRIGVAQP